MGEVLQANIFFFITGIAVIVFTSLLCVLLYHLIKVITSLRRILERVEEGAEVIAEDMSNLRDFLTEGGLLGRLVSALMGTGRRASRSGEKVTQNKKSTVVHITE